MKLDDLLKRVFGPGLCGCGCGSPCPAAKNNDLRTGAIQGHPLRYIRGHQNRERSVTDRERFDEHVYPDPNSGCFIWVGKTSEGGYGMFRILGRLHPAHRVAWLFEHGEIDDALLVRHKCDTPCCVNPDHLLQGTIADNAFDMGKRQRGHRSRSGLPYGVKKQVGGGGYQARAAVLGEGRFRSLGTFPTIEEAAAVADAARRQIYGEPR